MNATPTPTNWQLHIRLRAKDGKFYTINAQKLLAAKNRAAKYLVEAVRYQKEFDERKGRDEFDTQRHDQFLKTRHIPDKVWFPLDTGFNAADRRTGVALLRKWANGSLRDINELLHLLDLDYDLDTTYILFGIPCGLLTDATHDVLLYIADAFGSRNVPPKLRVCSLAKNLACN